MNIAIIGANSFLARNCISLFNEGCQLHLFSRSPSGGAIPGNAKWYSYELSRDGIGFLIDACNNFDVIIYCLAAGVQPKHTDSGDEIWNVNAFTPIQIIEVLVEKKFTGQLFTFGSYGEIGNLSPSRCLDEGELISYPAVFSNNYGLSKKVFTDYVVRRHESGIGFVHFHCILTNVYGVGENKNRLIPYIMHSVMRNDPLRFSSGSQIRQYTHVRDIAAWIVKMALLKKSIGGVVNLTVETTYTIREVVEKCLAFLETQGHSIGSVEFGAVSPHNSAAGFWGVSAEKARALFGWSPQTSLAEGIAEYHDVFMRNTIKTGKRL